MDLGQTPQPLALLAGVDAFNQRSIAQLPTVNRIEHMLRALITTSDHRCGSADPGYSRRSAAPGLVNTYSTQVHCSGKGANG